MSISFPRARAHDEEEEESKTFMEIVEENAFAIEAREALREFGSHKGVVLGLVIIYQEHELVRDTSPR